MLVCGFSCRMKRKFYSWEECMNLREVKVSSPKCSVFLKNVLVQNVFIALEIVCVCTALSIVITVLL